MHEDGQWFDDVWARIDDKTRAIYADRAAGRTLRNIGAQYDLSGERVRQIILDADESLVAAADKSRPRWRERVSELSREPAVSTMTLMAALGIKESIAVSCFAKAAGLVQLRVWGNAAVPDWWTANSGTLDAALRDIANAAPLRQVELESLPAVEKLPQGLPLTNLLSHSRSPLIQSLDGNWLRRAARGRDAAYLWLAERGTPCRAEELCEVMGGAKPHAIREALRRDDRFAQIRPEGTWVLVGWSHPGVNPYSSAEEAMIAVLEQEGGMAKERLFSRVTERYPVTPWRLQQCLLSDRIGMTAEGLIDLISRGAQPIEEREPAQPANMAVDPAGNVYGIRLTVDYDVIRGSGILVNTWLTWKLGLRSARMSKTFAVLGSKDDVVTVRRGTSGAQISSLRHHAQDLGTVIGCQLAVLLRVDDYTARIVHACTEGNCPVEEAPEAAH
ncbi:RNA polymerase subunit sigma-70 [Streptomyces bungoensis]|uniref:RNA polymerase subunit sigma-70 n=1 Tax=Streptomyces bungoensis TaxID=285568 RepID=UPI000AC78FE0|nr:RNA polymerase subunit sigma-70 [Streptomyces bungoensis]